MVLSGVGRGVRRGSRRWVGRLRGRARGPGWGSWWRRCGRRPRGARPPRRTTARSRRRWTCRRRSRPVSVVRAVPPSTCTSRLPRTVAAVAEARGGHGVGDEGDGTGPDGLEDHPDDLGGDVHAVGDELDHGVAAGGRGERGGDRAAGAVVHRGHPVEEVGDEGRRALEVGDLGEGACREGGVGVGVADGRADAVLDEGPDERRPPPAAPGRRSSAGARRAHRRGPRPRRDARRAPGRGRRGRRGRGRRGGRARGRAPRGGCRRGCRRRRAGRARPPGRRGRRPGRRRGSRRGGRHRRPRGGRRPGGSTRCPSRARPRRRRGSGCRRAPSRAPTLPRPARYAEGRYSGTASVAPVDVGQVWQRVLPVGEVSLDGRPVLVVLLAALVAVGVGPVWSVLRLGVTLVHELGHAGVGVLCGRRFAGFVLRGDMSGHAVTVGPAKGAGRVATTWAGYPAPAVVGAAAVALAVRGWAPTLLAAVLVVLVVAVLRVRSVLTAGVVLAVGAPPRWLWWSGAPTVQAQVLVGSGVVLVVGAWRHLGAVAASRRPLRERPRRPRPAHARAPGGLARDVRRRLCRRHRPRRRHPRARPLSRAPTRPSDGAAGPDGSRGGATMLVVLSTHRPRAGGGPVVDAGSTSASATHGARRSRPRWASTSAAPASRRCCGRATRSSPGCSSPRRATWAAHLGRTVATVLDRLLDEAPAGPAPERLGLVVPGLVDEDRGVGVWAANLGWRDLDLRAALADHVAAEVRVGHDVRAGTARRAPRRGGPRGRRRPLRRAGHRPRGGPHGRRAGSSGAPRGRASSGTSGRSRTAGRAAAAGRGCLETVAGRDRGRPRLAGGRPGG